MTQGESKLSRAIMTALRARGCWCMKIHGGPTMMAGAPDIQACVPVEIYRPDPIQHGLAMKRDIVGIFVGFETKMPEGKDPEPIQVLRHTQIRESYGQVFVVRSVKDAVAAIKSLGWVDPRPVPPTTTIGPQRRSQRAGTRCRPGCTCAGGRGYCDHDR